MNWLDFILTLIFVAAFISGFRGTWRQVARYRSTMPLLMEPRSYLIVGSFIVVSIPTLIAAGVLGVLGLRRLFGLEPFAYAGFILLVIATAIVWIPAFLDVMATRIENGGPKR